MEHPGFFERAGPFTLAEIATLIDGLGPVLETTRVFPGATVTAIHRKPSIDWSRGDDIPF